MAPTEPVTWSLLTWVWWLLGGSYWIVFYVAWFRFRRLERAVADDRPGAVHAFNAGITGFPWSGYAKMLGKRRLEEGADGQESGARRLDSN